ncbi:MAG: hypothetical protein ACYTGX_14630 [Planctomycetota bacterium]|jgi:hypothetical protein
MRKSTLAAVAVLAGVFASVPGCSDDGDTIINNFTTAASLPGNYPGAPETTHYVATDGGGLSEGAHGATPLARPFGTTSLSTGLRYFPSGVGGTGITLYLTTQGSNSVLWAQYYDGSRFTPPVSLSGANEDTTVAPFLSEASVLFLNTTDGRNGDAMIFWRRMDLDSTTPTERLYYSYFDVSLRSTAADATDPDIRHGFDTTAAAIDQGAAIADVTCIAVFSDGLHGSGIFIGDIAAPIAGPNIYLDINLYQQGDPTTFAGVAYVQAPNGSTGPRLHYRSLDFSNGTLRANQTVVMPGTANAAADVVGDLIRVYDGSLFFQVTDVSASETDLCWNVFGTTAFQGGTDTINPSGTNHSCDLPEALVGPDEGVVNIVGVFKIDNLGAASNKDIWAFQVDPVLAAFNSTNDRVEIDDDLAPANANQPVVDNASSVGGGNSLQAVPNRTGEWLLVSWLQQRGNTNSNDDGIALWARGIQLTRSGTAPAIGNRVTNNGGAAFQVDTITTDTGASDDDVKRYKNCQQFRYLGAQSDRYTTHLIWQQDQTSGGANDQLRTRGVTFTPSTVSTTAPGQLTGGTPAAPIVFLDGDLSLDGSNAAPSGSTGPGGWGNVWGVDGGGSGTGNFTGGLALVYVRNSGSAASPSFECMLRRQTGASAWSTVNVGSLGSGGTQQSIGTFGGLSPNNADITGSPDWAGNGIHIAIWEVREANQPLGNSTQALRHRYYDKTNSDVEANRFTPQITSGSPPVLADNGQNGSAFLMGAGANGETIGIWFLHNGHLWYQQWNPSARTWLSSGGAAAPELVDHGDPANINFTSNNVQAFVQTQPAVANPFNEIDHAMVFFQKWDKLLVGTLRWYARPRD